MDKKECLEVIELLSVSWDKPMDQTTLTARAKAFYEYIGDLPAAAVAKVIKDMAVAGRQWAPRPGELRAEAIAMMQEDDLPRRLPRRGVSCRLTVPPCTMVRRAPTVTRNSTMF